MRDVSKRNLSTSILNQKVSIPIGIAPTSLQKMAHSNGEIASARGELKAVVEVCYFIGAHNLKEQIIFAEKNRWCHMSVIVYLYAYLTTS